ncbi:unnamed protein product [Owenia fusiformis]|uniref:Coiled-coil domain-containing protein 17 n=1 Tax=Owenia fusiformis TaxID=6347 RepID=A0A8S4N3K7_OWEFU|nr:unnamed protein product [Owenia fusiformis]
MASLNTSLKCKECKMIFSNPNQLSIHKQKFCGGLAGSSQGSNSSPENTWNSKVKDLEKLKQVRQQNRSQRDREERQLLTNFRETPPPQKSPKQPSQVLSVRHSPDTRPQSQHELTKENTNSRQEQDNQAQMIHNRKLADIQNIGKSLEQRREDIRRRLDDLANGTPPQQDRSVRNGVKGLIQELREQELRNQESIEDLKRQVSGLNKARNDYRHSNKNALAAEISAMRSAYLRDGGSDPAVLAQMAELEYEATKLLEDQPQRQPAYVQHQIADDISAQILALELENKRLQKHLISMQTQNRNRDFTEDFQRQHMRKLIQLQQEMEQVKQQMSLANVQRNIEQLKQTPPNKLESSQNQPTESQAEIPALLSKTSNNMYDNDLLPAPYDPQAGFVVFYDYVLHLEPSLHTSRLIIGLFDETAEMGEPSILPSVYCEMNQDSLYQDATSMALIAAKQPVPSCSPSQTLSMVIELQASNSESNRLTTRAWTKMDLFDEYNRVISGRWKLPLRANPIKPTLPTSQLNTLAQYGQAEIYLRLVNYRDADHQSQSTASPEHSHMYQFPPQRQIPVYIPPPPSISPPESPEISRHSSSHASINRVSPEALEVGENNVLGFQVDRVKNAEAGEGKVRLTAYYSTSGKIVQSGSTPVTCTTLGVRSNFRYKYHVFGQQEAIFHDVNFRSDMVLIVRFYLRHVGRNISDEFHSDKPEDGNIYEEETLVAWGAISIMARKIKRQSEFSGPHDSGLQGQDVGNLRVNTGVHTIQLYTPPIPEPHTIPLEYQHRPKDWERYGKANVRIYMFTGTPRPGSLSQSDASDDEDENTIPQNAWLPHERLAPAKGQWQSNDGFDLYIDGCRFLPDSVTISRIAGRVLNRKYEKLGPDILTGVNIDSDIYNPIYNHRTEFRLPHIAATATLLVKVYTIDRVFKRLVVCGHGTLNIFVGVGTDRQPTMDHASNITLNEGCHQLRLYREGPNGIDAMTESCVRATSKRVPCATVLVRLYKAARGPQGTVLEANKVPMKDWGKFGLKRPMPSYEDRKYFSMRCKPTSGEIKLFNMMCKRKPILTREAAKRIASEDEGKLFISDKVIQEFIRKQLTKGIDEVPMEIDITYIAQYSPRHGIKFSLDSAMNLPWGNFTHGHYCLNPPGAFYMGMPHSSYDKLFFTKKLDLDSSNTSPSWQDGMTHFHRRSYHRFLTVIIHLQEISIAATRDNYKYALVEQAWSAVQVFHEGYANTSVYQLPLFYGAPTVQILKQLSREPFREWIQRNATSGGVKLIEGASIFVRLCDARRDDEMPDQVDDDKLIELNTDYLPPGIVELYSRENRGQPLHSLIPSGKDVDTFGSSLAEKFKNLVYKLYEEGNT